MAAEKQPAVEAVLSVSIVTYRIDAAHFSPVLESLSRAAEVFQRSESASVQVRILDNGDQEALLQQLAGRFQSEAVSYEIIGGLHNIGYGRAHNLAILTTKAQYHLILNPDVLLDPDCLVKGIKFLRQQPSTCAVAPCATDASGEIQYLCKRFPSVLDLCLRGFAPSFLKRLFTKRLNEYELRDSIEDEVLENVPLISGCFMLCRAEALKIAGGFDERFFLYFEDYALSMELNKIGSLAYLPYMKIRHFGGNSARKGLSHIIMFVHSGIKFFNTYGWKFI